MSHEEMSEKPQQESTEANAGGIAKPEGVEVKTSTGVATATGGAVAHSAVQ